VRRGHRDYRLASLIGALVQAINVGIPMMIEHRNLSPKNAVAQRPLNTSENPSFHEGRWLPNKVQTFLMGKI
jgi:hypothetical protein